MIEVKYKNLCLNCKREILSSELLKFGICQNCLSNKKPRNLTQVFKILKNSGKLNFFAQFFEEKKEFEEFCKIFQSIFKTKPTSLQQTWAKRVLLKKSFSIIAPPGTGKTIFGIIFSLFLSQKMKKSYIIVPTTLLVEQIKERMEQFSQFLSKKPNILAYSGNIPPKEKRNILHQIRKGKCEILITTDRFLSRNFSNLKNQNFDFVFVDDIDSFLKSSRNVEKVLKILGFSKKTISFSLELLEANKKLRQILKMKKKSKFLLKKINNLQQQIEKEKSNRKIGVLVVSGATLKAKRTKIINLFKFLLGFELASKSETLRNIKDFYIQRKRQFENEVLSLLKNWGGGVLIFVSSSLGKHYPKFLANFLKDNGIIAEIFESKKEEIVEEFKKGKIDALIGTATFKSPLIRGLDLPERIRYVIFVGVPRIEIKLTHKEFSPPRLLMIFKNLKTLFKNPATAEKIIEELVKITFLSKEMINRIKTSIEKKEKLEGFEEFSKDIILRAQSFLEKELNQELIEKISKKRELSLSIKGKDIYLLIPDYIAYLQGAGRASRLFALGISRGASFLIVDDEKSFFGLKEKLKYVDEEIEFKKPSLKILVPLFKKIDEDRKKIKSFIEGEAKIKKQKDILKTCFLIVESPTKARTIAKFFGQPNKRKFKRFSVYEVNTGKYLINIFASMGHIFDLTIGEGIHGVEKRNDEFLPIYDFIKICKDCNYQFTGFDTCPICKSKNIFSKEEIVNILKELAKEVGVVFLATDPDIEGEKISFDIYCSLFPINKRIKRLEFHEITKRALFESLKKQREIDLELVKAALVRRIEDRWLGFELSQKLWEKFKNKNLSAGRVQTPVLGWIIERTSESRKRKNILKIKLENDFTIIFEDPKNLPKEIKNLKVKAEEIKREEKKIFPPPPFTTDTLLSNSSSILKFSSSKTMELAQDLFEVGLITYHRTDSTTVAPTGIQIAKNFILENFGELFVPRNWKQEGAHECIRPTRGISSQKLKELISLGLIKFPKRLTIEHFLLYDLIFKRFIASQMKEISVLYQKISFSLLENKIEISHPIRILEEGFNKILFFPIGKEIEPKEYSIKFSKLILVPKIPLFTQGALISQMKERGIGRPSTYSKIIQVLLERKYIKEINNKIFSTPLGYKVFRFLSEKFSHFVSEETTKKLEETLDAIEKGEKDYQRVLSEIFSQINKIKGSRINGENNLTC